MKKFLTNKYTIGALILVAAGTITYAATWANKKWLLKKLAENGVTPDDTKSTAQLRKDLMKALKA